MKNYEKPVVLANEELAEGVYAGSGEGDCWTIKLTQDQVWGGGSLGGKTYRVYCEHISMQHISTASTSTIVFNSPIVAAKCENFATTVDGNTVTIYRDNHANAYTSHDEFNSLLEVKAADEATTRALYVVSTAIKCTKTTNVQGGGADGN